MDSSIILLDTPKKVSLQTQANDLRTALKDFERTFAITHNGRKPENEDIKADLAIAVKYKEYHKIRSLLKGKGSLDRPNSPRQPKRRSTLHNEDGSSHSQRQQLSHTQTPRKPSTSVNQLNSSDAPPLASPGQAFMKMIGPTPQRDGQAMGLFDLLYSSGSKRSLYNTPSTSRKRKFDAVAVDIEAFEPRKTPTQHKGDNLRNLGDESASPARDDIPASGGGRHSKTPVSEGRKLMLDQLFTTPSALRYARLIHGSDETKADIDLEKRTPLRDHVLGTPSKASPNRNASDTTPAFLRRSFSFKQRLLSAGSSSSTAQLSRSNSFNTTGPRTHTVRPGSFRTSKSLSEAPGILAVDLQRSNDDSDDDDDLDALREVEAHEMNSIAGDPKLGKEDQDRAAMSGNQQPVRVWKKKGQKRTTRRVIMRPVKMKPSEAPKFVTGDEDDYDGDEQLDHDSNIDEQTKKLANQQMADDQSSYETSEDELAVSDIEQKSKRSRKSNNPAADNDHMTLDESRQTLADETSGKQKAAKARKASVRKSQVEDKTKVEKTGRKYNPNATAHLNFRTLKIKNKNSKAKGRFGRRGRR